jgi:DNA-binding XRE family transcriptional regulator
MWSQAELAKKAGVSSKTIYNIEGGRPAYRITLGLIAKALNVEYRHLLLTETSIELLYNELIGRLNSGNTRAELLAYLQSSNFIVQALDRPAYHELKLHWNLRIGSFTLDLCIGELLETARRYSWHVVLFDEPTRYIFDEDGKPAAEVLAGIQ